jgi:6-phosphogluconolactonase
MLREYAFDTVEQAASAMVEHLGRLIRRHNARWGQTVFASGGGRTPRSILPRLAAMDCQWKQVSVTLTDDRCVPVDDPESNEGLVRECMLQHLAKEARFLGLNGDGDSEITLPNIVYLGFGEDGHVASVFPGGPELSAEYTGLIHSTAPIAPYRRISFTLPSLYAARHTVLLVSGAGRHEIYRRCRDNASAGGLPLARVLGRCAGGVDAFLASG